MKHSDIKSVTMLGIGGAGSFFLAKYFLFFGIDVHGFDIKESDKTKELEKFGAKIQYRNPEKEEKINSDLLIYSADLPVTLQNNVFKSNPAIKRYEVGAFYHLLVKEFEEKKLNRREMGAFVKSEIAPLFNIDLSKMRYLAVTGTDGKTTTCTMIYHILKSSGFKPALITTVAAYIGDEQIDTGFHTTTPTAQNLFELIKKAEKGNCTHMIIEATSHGLEQGRLAGLKFDNLGYTNISSDHMDYHKTWDKYCYAKSLLIREHLKDKGSVTLNRDDKSYEILSTLTSSYIDYSISQKARIQASEIVEESNRIRFKLNGVDASLQMLGKYNVSNFLCAVSMCLKEGVSIESSLRSMNNFTPVSGRMEILKNTPFVVIVDFAHTSNALLNALDSARKLKGKEGKVIHVFGCAGQRDTSKKYEMGKISRRYADITILTAEDPRLESLKEINDEITRGWEESENKNAKLIRYDDDSLNVKIRKDALLKAFSIAKEGDVVIVTGKAHEESLCFGQKEYEWNDIKEVKKILKEDSNISSCQS